MPPIMKNYSILDASEYSQQKLSNMDTGLDRMEEKLKHFSGNFDLFSDICVVHPLNFSDIFAETNTTTFFKIKPIKSF